MRYPVLSSNDANVILVARRSGHSIEVDRLVKHRGEGNELNQDFIARIREDLFKVRAKFRKGLASPADSNSFEARAARVIHQHVPEDPEMLGDAEFWTWLAVVHCPDIVEWRYGSPPAGATVANYGVGARTENFLFRLWLRAEIVLDDNARDRYHLCQTGQIDFYRSHLFRQGYANVRHFARALIRYQYPFKETDQPKLKVDDIRELVKRLRRLRSNLFLEILNESECRQVIEMEAKEIVG